MKYQDVLNKYFKGPYKIEKTNKGLTNAIYKVFYNEDYFALRIPKEDHHLIVNHLDEINVLRAVKTTAIDVEEVFYDQKSRIRITRWVNDIAEFKDNTDVDKYIRVAHLLKKLHSLPTTNINYFNPIALINKYQRNQGLPLYDTSQFTWIIDTIKEFNYVGVICHNDLVSGNILLSPNKDYLIDYEYAGINDPLFDLMSFITENNIENNHDRLSFYHAYFGSTPDNETLKKLLAYERFHNLLWLFWSTMMYNNRQEQVYKDIAASKYFALINSINKEVSL